MPRISTEVNGVTSPPSPSSKRPTSSSQNMDAPSAAAWHAAPRVTITLAPITTQPGPTLSMMIPPMIGPTMAAL